MIDTEGETERKGQRERREMEERKGKGRFR